MITKLSRNPPLVKFCFCRQSPQTSKTTTEVVAIVKNTLVVGHVPAKLLMGSFPRKGT